MVHSKLFLINNRECDNIRKKIGSYSNMLTKFMNKGNCVFICIALVLALQSCGTEPTEVYNVQITVFPEDAGEVIRETDKANDGEIIQVEAVANEHWVFIGWEGDIDSKNERLFLHMVRDFSLTAVFEKVEYPLTVEVSGSGVIEKTIVSEKTTDYKHGTTVLLKAIPDQEWEFVEWRGDLEGQEIEIEVLVEGPLFVEAVFKLIDYEITINTDGSGYVETEIVQSKSIQYPSGTNLKLTAIADYGWGFIEWRGDANGNDDQIFLTVNRDKEITAVFERSLFSLTREVNGEGTIIDSNSDDLTESYEFESIVELRAVPSLGWEFSGWSGDVHGLDPVIEVLMDSDKVVIANFTPIIYKLTVQISGFGDVLMNGVQGAVQEFPFGTEVELQAVPGNQWVFSGWTGLIGSSNKTIRVNVDRDISLNLNFRLLPDQIRILPLGDSITNGFPYSYRYSLYQRLTNSGYNFRFVGSRVSNPANYPGAWDQRHEGHNGITTEGINRLLPSWIGNYAFDSVLIHVGTNDIISKEAAPFTLERSLKNLEGIIQTLRNNNPVVRIFMAQIIPVNNDIGDNYEDFINKIRNYNQSLKQLALQKSTSVSPIIVVDMYESFDPSELTDGIHPTVDGAENMAFQWFNAIVNFK